MDTPNPLSLSAPSRVTSVAELRRIGADIPYDTDLDDSDLAEVRPHPAFDPNERAELRSRGVRRFLATVETERTLVQVEVETSEAWFVELMPLRILANVPEDASALCPVPEALDWRPDVVRGFATAFLHQWNNRRSPKRKTRGFLTAISLVRPSIAPVLQPAIRILSTSGTERLNKFQRRIVTDALELVIEVAQKCDGEGG